MNKRHFYQYSFFTGNERSDQIQLSTAAIILAVALIVSVVGSVVLTFIVTYVCVKRTPNIANNTYNPRNQSSEPHEKLLGEQECPPSYNDDLGLQPNSPYGASHGY